jgi:hypothetical protein
MLKGCRPVNVCGHSRTTICPLATLFQSYVSAMQVSLQYALIQSPSPAGILEAWSGIFNGMSREKADEFLKPASPHLIEYIETIYNDKDNQDDGAPGCGRKQRCSQLRLQCCRAAAAGFCCCMVPRWFVCAACEH